MPKLTPVERQQFEVKKKFSVPKFVIVEVDEDGDPIDVIVPEEVDPRSMRSAYFRYQLVGPAE